MTDRSDTYTKQRVPVPRTSAATKQQRRAHIMQAALRCFARAGFYATTMDDVAVQAGVSKGTPYLYFSSKAELYCALYEWWSCGLSDRVNAAIDALPEEARLSPRPPLPSRPRRWPASSICSKAACPLATGASKAARRCTLASSWQPSTA